MGANGQDSGPPVGKGVDHHPHGNLVNKEAKMIYSVEKVDKNTWQVVGPDGVEARFTTKWEADDFAYEMNKQARS